MFQHGGWSGSVETCVDTFLPAFYLFLYVPKATRTVRPPFMAWQPQETEHGQQVTFANDIVETDTAQFGMRRKNADGVRIFAGRTMVMESRLNKTWSVHALKDKASAGKRGSGGPESAEEVEPHLKRAVKAGVLVAPDGSCAFQLACSSLQKPLLKGVSHARKVFTPLTTFPKSKLGAFAHRTLKKCAEKNLARETRQSFSIAAGDNKAEGRLGAVKGNMRRLGVLRPKIALQRRSGSRFLLRQLCIGCQA